MYIMRDYVDYRYCVSLGLSQGLSLLCLSFLISLCVLGSLEEYLMNYEGIMCIRYIPNTIVYIICKPQYLGSIPAMSE